MLRQAESHVLSHGDRLLVLEGGAPNTRARLTLSFEQGGSLLLAALQNKEVQSCHISVLAGFSDPLARLRVGTLSEPSLLFDVQSLDVAGRQFDSNLRTLFSASTQLHVTLDPGTSSAGSLVVEIQWIGVSP